MILLVASDRIELGLVELIGCTINGIISGTMPSLLEALECKYGAKGEVNPSIDDLPVAIFVPKRSPRLSVPTLLVLNDCDIDCAGDACTLADKCADVVELDLANNKLTNWQEVK